MIANEIEVRYCQLEAVNTFPKKLDKKDCPDLVSAMQMKHLVKRKKNIQAEATRQNHGSLQAQIGSSKILFMENKTN